jgi:sigma-B regulation protein RsbU (phosphoserine phosphatase)
MAVSRTVMRNAPAETDMAQRMRDANRLLATGNTACMFVTMFSGVLDLETGRLRYCNAGHNSPYLLRFGGGRDLLKPTGIPFGIDPDRSYIIAETVLASGDTLFMFTDGITEAFNPAGDIFGEARLETVLDREGGIGATELVQKIIGATAEFAAGAEQSDDITCLALVYRG